MEETGQPLHYAITDFTGQLGPSSDSTQVLSGAVRRWCAAGVHYVQLREKSLDAGALLLLAERVAAAIRACAPEGATRPRLLVNGRPDVAVAARAEGVHLTARAGELTPQQARRLFLLAGLRQCTVSVSCHTLPEVAAARDSGADLILYGPVYEKRVGQAVVTAGCGVDALAAACTLALGVPVLALGGVTPQTVAACLAAGAAGVAGIRLFA